MEPHSEKYLRENGLIREMMKQGEFSCLVDLSDGDVFRKDRQFIIQWWCRKTDKMYESAAPTLMDALCSVLGQAHADPDPWVTEEQCAETAEKYKIDIYIPKGPGAYEPVHEEARFKTGDMLSRCLGSVPEVSASLIEIAKHAYEARRRLDEIEDVKELPPGITSYEILFDKLECRGWSRVSFDNIDESPSSAWLWVKPLRNPIMVTLDIDGKGFHVYKMRATDLYNML